MRLLWIAVAAALAAPAVAQPAAESTAKSRNVSIPFANHNGIQDWRSDGDSTLYLRGQGKQWYRATLMAPCTGLSFANAIGYVTDATGSFDKFSSIRVEGRPCQVQTLETIAGDPPAKAKKAK